MDLYSNACIVVISFLCINSIYCNVKISTQDIEITKGDQKNVTLEIKNYVGDIFFVYDNIVEVVPKRFPVNSQQIQNKTILLKAIDAGHTVVSANSSNKKNSDILKDVFVRVTVNKYPFLDIFSSIVGWIYFAAWSISFYPQIYINFKRKSVVGLNFDFVAFNLIGFTLYSIFNIGLRFIDEMKEEYSNTHPRSLNPVQLNDVFFSVHAAIATAITIFQCFIYERNEQRVSMTARGIIVLFALFLLGSTVLAAFDVIRWLQVLYNCSYVKLTITLIKYVPQAYMNYKRKSTVGWSIGNIILDFTGGILSVLQMIVNSFNYDDWESIFGDPTKFGLGFFSVVFDIFFIIQHYVLYRHTNYLDSS